MARRDPNTLDLTQQKLRIAEDVMVWPVRERGELVYRVEIPKLHRFYRVGFEEYVFISLLDGETTIPQACGLAASKLRDRAPTAAQAGAIGRWLLENELAHFASDAPPIRRPSAVGPSEKRNRNAMARLLGRLNPFWIKLPMPRCERLINGLAKLCRAAFSTRAVLLGGLMIIIAAMVTVSHWSELVTSTAEIFHPSNWCWLLVTWVVLKLVHELAHAIACDRQGGTVREAGLVFILFAPLAYVDVTSCWRMNSRWSRIAVASAGMYVELVIASVAVVLWAFVDDPQSKFLLQNLVFAAGLSTLLFNANVLMRFDGYFILADLIEVPNLYSEASSAVRRRAKRFVSGEEAGPDTLTGWRRYFVLGYGFAALFWRVLICFSLAVAAATMFAGAGIVIAALGVLVWLGHPLHQLQQFLASLRGRDPNRFLRAVFVGTLSTCAIGGLFIWFPIPTSVTVPAVARYLPETMVRTRASGFVSKIHVVDGSIVREGQLLLELENRELTNRLRQLEFTSRQNDLRLRKATDQHNAGERHVLLELQKSLRDQMAQLRDQAAGLRVLAPRSGHVIARGLSATLGTHVQEGDSLLIVAGEVDKELIAVVGQDVVKEVRPFVGSPIRIRTASCDVATGRLDRIEPRATDRLPNPSLAGTEGGSLAVRVPSGEQDPEELRLLQPHFRARLSLATDVAAKLPAGMRMEASFGYRTEPLASRIRQSIRHLWHAAHDDAAAY